ncbi:Fatty acid synthase subunit beta [Fusarium oxysporum f. sp. conglutinans]|nr:Fatty acid synthase subunit beta [Fusarium oxysporum f. sp. conglutinans]
MLQWTGGRGGGHHSFEDFHQPILQMYGRIRRQENIILVAGSGFGGADDTYPYITGEWPRSMAYPPMPFDGCLFGSRMMVAKEAHTSKDVKRGYLLPPLASRTAIGSKPIKDLLVGFLPFALRWVSPCTKLATRGVRFWAEMDQKIFSLPKQKRVTELNRNKDYIIKKLNDDYQKVWFGRNKEGNAVDLADMTYAEVLRRLVELLYIGHQSRWIHHSYAFLVGDYIHRLEERLASTPGKVSLLQSYSELNEPFEVTDRDPLRKPVNFIPVLDENFEFYFKKDSLWQSEDLDAVVWPRRWPNMYSPGSCRCKFSTQIDQPIQSILDSIHESHVEYLIRDLYNNNKAAIPYIEYFGGKLVDPEMPQDVEGLTVTYDNYKNTYRLSSSAAATLPKLDSWLSLVAGPNRNWRHALLMADVVAQGQKFQANPIRRIFTPSRGLFVEISYPNDPSRTTIVVREQPRHNQYIDVIEVKLIGENKIQVNMIKETTALGKPAALPLEFTYHPEAGYSPIREAWFGEEPLDLDADVTAKFDGGKTTITGEAINDFVHAVGNHGEALSTDLVRTVYAPMDFAIVIGWKAITKPIFPRTIDGDLLKLVHLSNQFRMIPGAEPLKKGRRGLHYCPDQRRHQPGGWQDG